MTDLSLQLDRRLIDVETLIDKCTDILASVHGYAKLRNKIRAEHRFLLELRNNGSSDEFFRMHLDTSNVIHFKGVFSVIVKLADRVEAVLKTFSIGTTKITVDLVIDDGARWIKVISRNARSLHSDWLGSNNSHGRSLVEQAEHYLQMARQFPFRFHSPTVVFQFTNGVPHRLAAELTSMGVLVQGNGVKMSDINGNSSAVDDDVRISDTCDQHQSICPCIPDQCIHLDITAVFVLISALTEPFGANFHFRQPLLNEQSAFERLRPARPVVHSAIFGKRLLMCRTGFERAQSIVNIVGGNGEKARAKILLENLEILPDASTERAERLKLSDKISKRAKIIFGAGDYYEMMTLTANRHFVQAASNQGLNFAVILHESRALSEQKQAEAIPLETDKIV